MAITTERIRELLADAAEPTAWEREGSGAVEPGRRPARRQAYPAAIAATAVLALVGVVMLLAARDHGRPGRDQVRPAASTSASPTAAASTSLVGGHWMPSSGAPTTYIAFLADGTWNGFDGCNHFGGTYTYTSGGTFSATMTASTLAYCRVLPIGKWLTQAKRAEISGTDLRLFDQAGQLIGTLVRPSA